MGIRQGHTVIENALLEAILKGRFSSVESDVIFYILRRTSGEGRKSAQVSLSDFVKATFHPKARIIGAIKTLTERRVIIALENNTRHGARELRLNIKYEDWTPKEVKKVSRLKVLVKPEVKKEKPAPEPEVKSGVNTSVELRPQAEDERRPVIKTGFQRPELNEVIEYFTLSGYTKEQAERFYTHFDSQDWMSGQYVIKNWKSKAREVMLSPGRYYFIFEDKNGYNKENGHSTGKGHVDRGKGSIDEDKYRRQLRQVNY